MIKQRQPRPSSGSHRQSPQPTVPTSPQFQPRSERLYSFDEVREWCDKLLQSKFKYLTLEIAENTETIRQLNERLNHNERELERKEKLLSVLRDREQTQITLPVGAAQSNAANNADLSNKLTSTQLEEKLTSINTLLRETQMYRQGVLKPTQSTLDAYQSHMEGWIDTNMTRIKQYIKEKCHSVKRHNSEYWSKIKNWVQLFEERLRRCEGAIQSVYEETQNITLGDEFMGLYRLKNSQTRFRELEEAVVDLEEGFKLAAETQEEMRELLWQNDRADFLEGRQFSEIAENYRPEAVMQGQEQVKPRLTNRGSIRERLTNNLESISPLPNRKSNTREQQSIANIELIDFQPPTESNIPFERQVDQADSYSSMVKVMSPKPTEESEPLLRERILNMIAEHNLQKPVPCYLDEFSYLKSNSSTYLFDQLGDMIKLSGTVYSKFCNEGLLQPFVPAP